ncbi:peptidase M22, glycoprotease [Hesseltinella vesiculosa]|uniref:N(6)-L-threonylcarbamoyladenine synthase n=1 Tax=Hesseltinella vesiculosa TaxID=101127 RepID=A0A1X2GP15_9FUNG|nr:peptidase M22, glycoprotease [Hesseltinella vesiculosa]
MLRPLVVGRPCRFALQKRWILSNTQNKPLVVLGIETSCDDTSAAIVRSDRTILSEVVRGQQSLHEPMGGVVPTLASKGHSENMPGVICEALDKAQLTVDQLDAIAVTRGPGLPPCLPVGLNAAKTLAAVHKKPLIGVHHMEGHALTARLASEQVQFPFMALLISGGHTLLLVAHQLGHYQILATTLDDAMGEAIDKTARALALPWVKGRRGGPGAALEQAALQGDPARFASRLPMPMLQRNKSVLAFSFSGLKTAVARLIEKDRILDHPQLVSDMAAAFQTVCVQHLEQKLTMALENETQQTPNLSALVVSGGVASNLFFRSRLKAGLVDDYTITTLPKWSIESLKESSTSKN